MANSISVVVIARDEEKEIRDCLESIASDNPAEIIVIIDSRTKDNTADISGKYSEKIIIAEGTRGHRRNIGWNEASNEIICFVDADMRVEKGYFEKMIEEFSNNDKLGSAGGALLPLGKSLAGRLEWVLWDNSGDFGAGGSVFRKAALIDTGGFNDTLNTGEDADIAMRLVENGWERKLINNLKIYHRFAQKWNILIRKWRYGGRRINLKAILLLLASPVRAPLIAIKYKEPNILWFYPLRWFILSFMSGKKGYKPI